MHNDTYNVDLKAALKPSFPMGKLRPKETKCLAPCALTEQSAVGWNPVFDSMLCVLHRTNPFSQFLHSSLSPPSF